jgi:hypothetical protein
VLLVIRFALLALPAATEASRVSWGNRTRPVPTAWLDDLGDAQQDFPLGGAIADLSGIFSIAQQVAMIRP